MAEGTAETEICILKEPDWPPQVLRTVTTFDRTVLFRTNTEAGPQLEQNSLIMYNSSPSPIPPPLFKSEVPISALNGNLGEATGPLSVHCLSVH